MLSYIMKNIHINTFGEDLKFKLSKVIRFQVTKKKPNNIFFRNWFCVNISDTFQSYWEIITFNPQKVPNKFTFLLKKMLK